MIQVRRAIPEDLPFVLSSWLECWREAHYAGTLSHDDYFAAYRKALTALLDREDVEVLVAVNPQETERKYEIYGYLCHEKGYREPTIHWAYVKFPFRRNGVLKGLLTSAGIDPAKPLVYTHKTADCVQILQTKNLRAKHDPWRARQVKRDKKGSR
ncbi:MAG TPA: hypothetical protein VEA41_15310 [Salinarimonas sp.]|nr:hypothetical protein [Salinarimonas sp.]